MVNSRFATPARIVETAFDQITIDAGVPAGAKAKLKPLFADAHRSGDPRQERNVVMSVLVGVSWGAAYFQRWRERFQTEGAFPYMWRAHAKPLASDGPLKPATIEDALGYLPVADLRRLLVALDALPEKGRPRRRSEFVSLLTATGRTEDLVGVAMPAYDRAHEKWLADLETAKCALLAHTVTMRACTLSRRAGLSGTSSLRPQRSDCPVETAYAARFLAGEIRHDPPFFPGDRTTLILDRRTS